jgi:hypothetical protein
MKKNVFICLSACIIFETAKRIKVKVVWVVTPCKCCGRIPAFHPEDEGSMVFRNVGILPQPYTASQSSRPRPEDGGSFDL